MLTPALRFADHYCSSCCFVRGKLHMRGETKRADYPLLHTAHLPLAVIEAKDNQHSVGAGMQQALGYAEALDIPFVYSKLLDGLYNALISLAAAPELE